eukprot:TRINITY_DN4883_c0_g1_i1.p1 TRINITY_DN4883_c0_g1~~TRINITY_DN4883_c0_g1_i1.p1  ORF type:complete len:155 (+),score=36.89 TRINITY_DN4883_c0_g1_i1:30-467(+)
MALFVGRISSRIRERDLEELFEPFGKLTRNDVKGTFAFVTFEDERDAQDAIDKLDRTDLDGQSIIVEWAKSERSRRAPNCYDCGRRGHFARDCRTRDRYRRRSRSRDRYRRRSRSRDRDRYSRSRSRERRRSRTPEKRRSPSPRD